MPNPYLDEITALHEFAQPKSVPHPQQQEPDFARMMAEAEGSSGDWMKHSQRGPMATSEPLYGGPSPEEADLSDPWALTQGGQPYAFPKLPRHIQMPETLVEGHAPRHIQMDPMLVEGHAPRHIQMDPLLVEGKPPPSPMQLDPMVFNMDKPEPMQLPTQTMSIGEQPMQLDPMVFQLGAKKPRF